VMRALLRDVVLVASGQDANRLPHARHAKALIALTERADVNRIIGVVDACARLEDRMTLNPNPRLALQALLVEAGTRLRP